MNFGLVVRKSVFSDSDQARYKSAWIDAEYNFRLEILDTEARVLILSITQTFP